MNEEIKALIEREAIERRFEISQRGIEYFNEKKGIHNVVGVDPAWLSVFNDAYEIDHKNALSLFRWRKVEEELPEIMEEPYFINVRREGNIIETLYIEEGTNCIDVFFRMDVIAWMLIPN